MRLLEMRLTAMQGTRTEIQEQEESRIPALLRLGVSGLKVFWTSLSHRVRSKRKALSVCETAALGDHRFVSVVRIERQRFLIGSSSSSVTLLARLPDEAAVDDGDKEQENDSKKARQQRGEIS